MQKELTKQDVKKRIASWIQRLNGLFAQLEVWAQDHPDCEIKRGKITQINESLMQAYGLEPRLVPTLTFFVDKKYRVAFVPSALWVVGANGRVNVTTNFRQYILVDLALDEEDPKWVIVSPKEKNNQVDFNRDRFIELLGERS